MVSERRMMFVNARHGLPNGPRDAGSGALGIRARAPIAAAHTDGAGELTGDEVTLGFRLCGAPGISAGAGLLEVLLDIGEPPPVRLFGSSIQHRAGITGVGSSLDRHEIEHVDLAPWNF